MNQLVQEPLDLSQHPLGINNVAKETSLPDGALRSSVNFDISNDGKKKVRPGYVKVYSGSGVHSLSGELVTNQYFVEGSSLKQLNRDYTAVTLATVSSDVRRTMRYVQIEDRVFYSNGLDSGMIQDGVARTWGVDPVDSAPIISITDGQMKEGNYSLKYVAVRDGEESAATGKNSVYVTAGQGIQLVNIPTHASADEIHVYMTKANGTVFYKVAEVPEGISTWSISGRWGKELETDNLYNAPVGHLMDLYNGRIYLASNNLLIWTEAINYGLSGYNNFIEFPSRITVMGSTDSGIYVVADQVYYMRGGGPEDFKLITAYQGTAIEGTQYKLTHNFYNQDDYYGRGLYWLSSKGLVRGQNNGNVVPLTEKVVSLPNTAKGSAGFIEHDGIRKLVTTLSNANGSGNLRAADKVTVSVTRANEVT